MLDKIDIAIVGRGLIGGIAALALSKTGATVALIDKIKKEKGSLIIRKFKLFPFECRIDSEKWSKTRFLTFDQS